MRVLAAVVLVALAAACATAEPPRGADRSVTSEPTPSDADDPAGLVRRADNLYGAYVRRSGSTYGWRSLWGVGCDHDECTPVVLVSSEPGGETGYQVGSYERLQKALWAPRPAGAPAHGGCATSVGGLTLCVTTEGALSRTDDGGGTWTGVSSPFVDPLLARPLVSLAPGVEAVVGGGDGATRLPFEQMSRLWSADDVTNFHVEPVGPRDYATGAVVLSDGRVLTLLEVLHDGRGRPDRADGLWVSDGEDWSTYDPWEPVFSPPLTPPPGRTAALVSLGASVDPDPVIWVQTWDQRIYVSTDSAATFTELPVRGAKP